jgi:c(7)-type cytochrome triheme protein
MLTPKLKTLLVTGAALLVCAPVAISLAAMDPAPADWPNYEYNRAPGEFKRNKYGIIDPSPDVVSLQQLPVDSYGFVDWTKAMRDSIIAPRESISGKAPRLGPEDSEKFSGDVLIKSKMKFMPDVIFPHSAHTEWLKCSTCHPRIFKKKAGATPITMTGIWNGQFCGRCHDKVAFPTRNCFKCHSVPRSTSK